MSEMTEHFDWLGSVFGGTDVISPGDMCDYFDVIYDAFNVHVDRERIRDGLWKEYPAEDQCNQIKVKIDRVLRSLERKRQYERNVGGSPDPMIQNAIEELFDIINYANFAVRILAGRV